MNLDIINVKKLDGDFLNRAEKVTSFNIKEADLVTVSPARKNEIRYLFLRYFFKDLKSNVFIKGNTITANDMNASINKLKAADSYLFMALHNYMLAKGIGPGEVTVYFLYDNAYLGGSKSKGADVKLGTNSYEIKSVKARTTKSGKKQFYNFFTGGTIDVAPFIASLLKLAKANNLTGSMQSVYVSDLRKINPEAVKEIEKKYAEKVYKEYFSLHDTVFINSETGVAEAVMGVTPGQIGIGEVTQGKIKPTVTK